MILALDIGNTHIVMGCMEGRDIRYLCRMATNRLTTGAEYAVTISRLLEFAHIAPDAFDGAIISSVVPQVTRSLSEAVKMLSGIEAMVVGPGIRSDLAVRIDDPATLGSDLLSSTPRQLWLYRELGLTPPTFYHLPLLLAPDGRRLSKRDGDQSLENLRAKYGPEEIIGKLAFACGLQATPRPVTPQELAADFNWAKVPKNDIVLPESMF